MCRGCICVVAEYAALILRWIAMSDPRPPKDCSEPSTEPAIVQKSGGLLRSSGVVSIMTMLSRVLGLVRDVVVANFFGATAGADAFFVAFKIPNFFRRLFAEGAFSQAFVPVFSEYRAQRTSAEVRSLAGAVAGVLGLVLLIVTALAVLGAPWLTALFAPGFIDEPTKYTLASEMLAITFPYLMLISLTAYAGSMLNSFGYFGVPAFTPVLLNVVLIASALYLTPLFSEPVLGLAWGVLLAGMVQLFFQLPFLIKMGLLPRPRVDYRHEGVRRIGTLMLPALFGVSVSQINLLLDTVLASFLETGSISWLYYSDRLAELPLGVFGIAIATVILPSLSKRHASVDASGAAQQGFSHTLDWAARVVMVLGLPAALALIVLAEPLMTTLFFYGALTERDVFMSSMSLQAYAAGLLAFMYIKIFASGYFSRQDMKTPVRIGIIAMVANMVFNLVLIWPLQHTGLALATALSSWLNALLLLRGLMRDKVYRFEAGWGVFMLRIVVSSVAMISLVSMFNPATVEWFAMDLVERCLRVAMLVGIGVAAYFGILWLLGFRYRSALRPPKDV